MAAMYPTQEATPMQPLMVRQEDPPYYVVIRLTGALAIPEMVRSQLVSLVTQDLRQKYPELGAEAEAIRKILSEPWCPDGVVARVVAWNMNKRNILRRACDRLGLPHAGLGIEVDGC